MQSAPCHAYKLRRIPETLTPLLKKLVISENGAVVFSGKSGRSQTIYDAVIIGSEKGLAAVSDKLRGHDGKAGELGLILHIALQKLKIKPVDKLLLGSHVFLPGSKTYIMGILNVTPDSFSDGGKFDRFENALAQAFEMFEDGADIIDIGGESTRPGSIQITAEEELKRVMPVIEALKKDNSFKLPLSIDTYKADVAEQAMAAGVEMLNDVWAFKEDPGLAGVAADYGVPVCLMHNRRDTEYEDLIPDIIEELEASINLAHRAGVEDRQIIIDPGIGFGKNYEQNLDVMLHLQDLCKLGYPLLLGTSRKSMIGKTLDLPAEERLEGTAATVAYGIAAGADIIRVHDVRQMKRVAVMTDAMTRR